MRKGLLFLTSIAGFSLAQEPELIVYPKSVSTWEVSAMLGGVHYKEKVLGDTWIAGLRADYRIKYPFLAGGGFYASGSSDLLMLYPELRAKVRIPLFSSLKLDLVGSADLGYADNKVLKKKKIITGAGAGAELLFFTEKAHLGLSISYVIFSDSRFNSLRGGLVIGF